MFIGIYLIQPIVLDILRRFVDILGTNKGAAAHLNPREGVPLLSVIVFFASLIAIVRLRKTPYLQRTVG